MSRMISLYEEERMWRVRIEGYMLSSGEIHYSFIRNGCNTGLITEAQKNELIAKFKMVCKFDNEAEAKEEFELLGFLL